MSVICQNFVQNAWKKDLCSNCFKSVGDHDNSIFHDHPKSHSNHQNGSVKKKSVAHTTVFQKNNSPQSNPHTTWKTLISEKNSKNGGGGQPFRLENGFQGRLLTINNKAEKKTGFTRSASSDDILHSNGVQQQQVTTNGHHPVVKPHENGALVKSDDCPSPVVKSDQVPAPLPGILKKTVPCEGGGQRRGSNVGFKEEEPLVIGYGGRDFSPEELEWDMNVSDVDNGSDSLDETEDDRAFSKMTKRNTEFNSDNSNLLKKGGSSVVPPATTANGDEGESEASRSVGKGDKKENGAIIKSEGKGGERENGSVASNRGDVKENGTIESTEKRDARENGTRKLNGKGDQKENWIKSNGKGDERENGASKSRFSGREEKEEKKSCENSEVKENGTIGIIDVKEKNKSNSKIEENDDYSKACIKSEHEKEVAEVKGRAIEPEGVGEVTFDSQTEDPIESNQIVDAVAGGESAGKGDKCGGAAAPSAAADRNSPLGSVLQSNLEMFTDDGANTLPGEEHNSEWQHDGVAGQILQAINTSLANRHKMSEDEGVNGGPVEPRASFLHGAAPKPSAIYGPASDLFVTRSDSSSSSSSEEGPRVAHNGAADDAAKPTGGSCNLPNGSSKPKPEVPAKPAKPLKKFVPKPERRDSDSSDTTTQGGYYSVGNASDDEPPKSIGLVDHYAEGNIYHDLDDPDMRLPASDKADPRESKLAALAMELEQVRHCNGNTKRQAPAPPPKIPEPPLEDPPNSSSAGGRTSPDGFSSFRGEAMAFSSSSSTASTSSQDTEAGYASWNIHGDLEDPRTKKSKGSFLLAQYSKCKMLAMGYADDGGGAKSRKRFSLKKLLKIQKKENGEADANGPKAWKYSDHFERPRAKLEIIHPMDLENRSVTVNPGFDSLHSGSMSSFAADDVSLRNSVSSDYGSFYSDAVSPVHDSKHEVNYECIPQQDSITLDEQEEPNEIAERGGSNSPTPSRTSTVSQASTLTSGSSKNGGGSPHRPPKPPPPPRAHSLLPGSKALNPDGTFKFPVLNGIAAVHPDVVSPPTKPQAPKRQCKSSSPPKADFGIYDNAIVETSQTLVEKVNEDITPVENGVPADENPYGTILDIQASNLEKPAPEILVNPKMPVEPEVVDSPQSNSQPTVQEVKAEPQQSINISVKVKPVSEPIEKIAKPAVTRKGNSPLTKAPAWPPPIYMKSQISGIVKNPNPWKTLEDSYLVLTASNRELLIKLVNQALKKRKNHISKLEKLEFQWSDFEIDVEQPSAVFAFGEKIAYHATMPNYPEYAITLVVTVQQHDRMNENSNLKYPVFGHFVDYIPKELLDENYASDAELESMQATVLVLDRSNISTIECFSESLPSRLNEEQEKELCFIILQMIHSLKSLQAHGIESIDPSFQNLVLAKTSHDQYHSLVFLSDGCYDDESDYDSCCNKISLCQYTLMLLFQMLGIQSAEEFFLPPPDKFSSETSRRVFETAVSLLSEERAVSLSQTKTLFECFLWGVTGIVKKIEDSDDVDSVLQRWLDIKRSGYIKSLVDDEGLCDINVQSEYLSQFLTRTSVRSIKEVVSYL